MMTSLDSSVIVAALHADEEHHRPCFELLRLSGLHMQAHGIAECFGTLTGGRLGIRVSAEDATRALERIVRSQVTVVNLTADEYIAALAEARSRGVRGGAIHDYFHLVAARKVGAVEFYTLNISDFRSFHRPGDPEIVHP